MLKTDKAFYGSNLKALVHILCHDKQYIMYVHVKKIAIFLFTLIKHL